MRPKLVLPLVGLLLLACIGFYATSDGKTPAATPPATDERLAVYFSPKGGCTVAASIQGASLPGVSDGPARPRQRIRLAELQRSR